MNHLIYLDWYRDPDGYRLTDDKVPEKKGRASTILDVDVWPGQVVPNSKKRQHYRPLDENPCLFAEFAQVKKPQQLLAFCNKYGLLGWSGQDVIEHDLAAAARLRKAIDSKEAHAIDAGTVETGLIFSKKQKFYDIYLKPKTLLTGLWLQFWVAHAENSEVVLCTGCRAPFKRGPNTGRRADAKFCCNEHRITHNSQRRAQAKHH